MEFILSTQSNLINFVTRNFGEGTGRQPYGYEQTQQARKFFEIHIFTNNNIPERSGMLHSQRCSVVLIVRDSNGEGGVGKLEAFSPAGSRPERPASSAHALRKSGGRSPVCSDDEGGRGTIIMNWCFI
jgi:hypothetical protein